MHKKKIYVINIIGDIMDFVKKDILVDNKEFWTLEVKLAKTTLIMVGNNKGFIMCGALNVSIYNTERMRERKVICANVLGVKSVEDMLDGYINDTTLEAYKIGIRQGMSVREALSLLS